MLLQKCFSSHCEKVPRRKVNSLLGRKNAAMCSDMPQAAIMRALNCKVAAQCNSFLPNIWLLQRTFFLPKRRKNASKKKINEQYFVAIIVQICREKKISKCELLVFQVLESRNSVEKRLCKFEAEGREFVTFSRHCSCQRELGKQVTNTKKKL